MSIEDSPEPTRSTEYVELSSTRKEARVLPISTWEGTSEGVAAASAKPDVIILQEFSTVVTKPFGTPPS